MSRIAWLRFAWPAALAVPALLGALPGAARAQDAADVLQPVAEALGVERVAAVRIDTAGSGYEPLSEEQSSTGADRDAAAPAVSSAAKSPAATATSPAAGSARAEATDPLYVPPPPPPTRRYFRIESESREIDLEAETLAIERVRRASAGAAPAQPATEALMITRDAPWTERHRYWMTPHGFVRGALAGSATVSAASIDRGSGQVVTFRPEGGADVRGYVDGDRIVRIETTVDEGAGSVGVEQSFLHWEELDGIAFPTTLIRRENGELAEVLIVRDIDVRTPG